jgi:CheY-like chemotaxis protein
MGIVQRHRIMCVDNEPDMQALLAERLSAIADVTAVEGLDEAMDVLVSPATRANPFAIVILDMRMPSPKDAYVPPGVDTQQEFATGRMLLESLIGRSCTFNVLPEITRFIIYTQYYTEPPALMRNAACMQAGAYAFLPKTDPDTNASTIDDLVEVCRRLISESDPIYLWVKRNATALAARYAGKYVAPVRAGAAQRAGLDGEVIDGYVLVASETARHVLEVIVTDSTLRWEPTKVFHITSTGSHSEAH